LSAGGAFSVNFGVLPYCHSLMASHERLIHAKIASKNASAIISNPNGKSRFKTISTMPRSSAFATCTSMNKGE
jgi:hypothetical protein